MTKDIITVTTFIVMSFAVMLLPYAVETVEYMIAIQRDAAAYGDVQRLANEIAERPAFNLPVAMKK